MLGARELREVAAAFRREAQEVRASREDRWLEEARNLENMAADFDRRAVELEAALRKHSGGRG